MKGVRVPSKEIKEEFMSKYRPLEEYIEELEAEFMFVKEEALELIKYYDEFPEQLTEESIDEIDEIKNNLFEIGERLRACYISRSGMMFELILKVKKN